jgi:phage tail sheath protein FI
MPQYLSPGVYVEEVSFRTGTIEGVSTSTAAFVGPTRYGPITGTPTLLTCLSDYVAIYGSIDPLVFADSWGLMTNYVGQAVRAFFDNGGGSLYISRTWNGPAQTSPPGSVPAPGTGYALATLQPLSSPPQVLTSPPQGLASPAQTLTWSARYPGAAGNVILTITFLIGQNVLANTSSGPTVRSVNDYDLVWITSPSLPEAGGAFYGAESYLNKITGGLSWTFYDVNSNPTDISLLNPATDQVRIFTANLQITYEDGFPAGSNPRTDFYPGLTFHPSSPTSFANTFAGVLNDSYYALTRPIVFTYPDTSHAAGIGIAQLMLEQVAPVINGYPFTIPNMIAGHVTQPQYTEQLTGGFDGSRPLEPQYQGTADPSNPLIKTGLVALEDVTDVSIVAAPGSTFRAGGPAYSADGLAITNDLIAHCEKPGLYRIAVLDSPDSQGVSDISNWRGQIDSTYAALYYPWVRILDPVTNQEANMPPSGYVAGIYARSDNNYGVSKAPANEVVTDALSFEVLLNKGQQDLLNPLGINCFRFFEGRGYRLWGARLISSDTEWIYVNPRRYMLYLEHSIDLGTQSLVFANNGPDLWASTAQLITDFLSNEFANGRLFGTTKAQAFFVRCDLTTMTQNDLDNGRLVCLIGVALLKPAEFVIFRIGQFTASSSQL